MANRVVYVMEDFNATNEWITELDDYGFHVCDTEDCLNSATPYKDTLTGDRLCVTCAHE